jgi:hypothetical protein
VLTRIVALEPVLLHHTLMHTKGAGDVLDPKVRAVVVAVATARTSEGEERRRNGARRRRRQV